MQKQKKVSLGFGFSTQQSIFFSILYFQSKIADDILMAVSDSGSSNNMIALDWRNHFERFSSRRQIGAYQLLLINGLHLLAQGNSLLIVKKEISFRFVSLFKYTPALTLGYGCILATKALSC